MLNCFFERSITDTGVVNKKYPVIRVCAPSELQNRDYYGVSFNKYQFWFNNSQRTPLFMKSILDLLQRLRLYKTLAHMNIS